MHRRILSFKPNVEKLDIIEYKYFNDCLTEAEKNNSTILILDLLELTAVFACTID